MDEINEINVTVRTDVHGSVNVRSAGKFADTAADGTVRPSSVPRYVSALSGVSTGPFFHTPKASATAGYLYMRILSIEDVEGKPDYVYFVIRNGIDTLATTSVSEGGNALPQRRHSQPPPQCPGGPRMPAAATAQTGAPQYEDAYTGDGDSVFGFAAAGAGRRNRYPERGTSAAYGDARSHGATQAVSSVFYDPGADVGGAAGGKGLAQSRVTEETRGVAVVHVGEMLNEVFLRGLVDSWDVEN
ncbi:hypothetical protein H4S07_005785, partial [Coemansia furcata]